MNKQLFFYASIDRKRGKAQTLIFILLGAILLLSACGLRTMVNDSTRFNTVKIVTEVNANQNTATTIDIVFVYDANADTLLPKTSSEWFEKKTAFIQLFATNIDLVSLQVPPATRANVALPDRHSKAIGVYAFVNFLSDDSQVVGNLTSYKTMEILLTPTQAIYKGN